MTRRTRRAMTLREFQATGRLVDNIAAHPNTSTAIVRTAGRVYAGGAYIQRGVRPRRAGERVRYEEIDSGRFWVLHIGSLEHGANHEDLARLERLLFEWAQREGLIRTEDQPVPEHRPMPSRIAGLRRTFATRLDEANVFAAQLDEANVFAAQLDEAIERARTERERIIAGNASTTPNRGAREAMHARERAFTDTYATDTETRVPESLTLPRWTDNVGPHSFANWGRDNVPPPPPAGWRDEAATLPQWANNLPVEQLRNGELHAAMERVRNQMMRDVVQDNRIPGGYPPPRETTSINVRTMAEAAQAMQRALSAAGGRAPDYIVAGPRFAQELMHSQGRTPDSDPVGNLRFMGIPVRITSWEMDR